MEPHKNLWSKSGRENQALSLVYLFVKITTLYFKVPLSTHIPLSNFIKECIFQAIRARFADNVYISVPTFVRPLLPLIPSIMKIKPRCWLIRYTICRGKLLNCMLTLKTVKYRCSLKLRRRLETKRTHSTLQKAYNGHVIV